MPTTAVVDINTAKMSTARDCCVSLLQMWWSSM